MFTLLVAIGWSAQNLFDRLRTSLTHFYSNEDIKVFYCRKVKMYLYTLLCFYGPGSIFKPIACRIYCAKLDKVIRRFVEITTILVHYISFGASQCLSNSPYVRPIILIGKECWWQNYACILRMIQHVLPTTLSIIDV